MNFTLDDCGWPSPWRADDLDLGWPWMTLTLDDLDLGWLWMTLTLDDSEKLWMTFTLDDLE